jgi:hypothetical protein
MSPIIRCVEPTASPSLTKGVYAYRSQPHSRRWPPLSRNGAPRFPSQGVGAA